MMISTIFATTKAPDRIGRGKIKLTEIPLENPVFAGRFDKPIIIWDVIRVTDKSEISLRFVSTNSPNRQGVWLKTDSGITVEDTLCPSLVLWNDTAPPIVRLGLNTKNGLLHIYNIWERDGIKSSQSHTSGMYISCENGRRIYGCNDIGFDPDFTKLVFEITLD